MHEKKTATKKENVEKNVLFYYYISIMLFQC